MFTRRQLLQVSASVGAGLCFSGLLGGRRRAQAYLAGGTLNPTFIPKYEMPLLIPPAMPHVETINQAGGPSVDFYEIAVREFSQDILPLAMGLPPTTVWGYGAPAYPGTVAEGGSFSYPAFTIEALWRKPVRVKWINELVGADGGFLPHLLPVDQTLHWANPPGTPYGTDSRGDNPFPYVGPVPLVTHVHGAHTNQESDGYPEAWYLPAANNLPDGIFRTGTFYGLFRDLSPLGGDWTPGSAVFQYPNDQRATALWFHDHTLGMTRQNVYAGPTGFYLLRGGPDDVRNKLPGPAPALGDAPGTRYYEIPIAIQDRSFNGDGSLFYPDNRAFFEGLSPDQLKIPFIPETVNYSGEESDVPPIWNPEFFGNTIVVNGRTWPYLEVEQRRYRFRLLNGCNSRFLILTFDRDLPFYQVGAEGGFLPAPVELHHLLMAPAERADVVVDFTNVPAGTELLLLNLGPDEPFGGGVPFVDFDPADPNTTGQVMQFRVIGVDGSDASVPAMDLNLPLITRPGPEHHTRQLSLNEEDSRTVLVSLKNNGNIVSNPNGTPFGPTAALLGEVDETGGGVPRTWSDPVTETPALGSTELWEIRNFTADAHPIHVHLVQFEVVNRETSNGDVYAPQPWETGFKDTVIAYPGEITRIRARFDRAGLFVWHCHILEHEDNEMMRPFVVMS